MTNMRVMLAYTMHAQTHIICVYVGTRLIRQSTGEAKQHDINSHISYVCK